MSSSSMVVEVTNVTDFPGKDPREIEIFGRTLAPGESLKVSVALIDQKTRSLAGVGPEDPRALIAIGSLPSWYEAFKSRRGESLSHEEIKRRFSAPVAPPAVQSVTPEDSLEKPARRK